MADKRRMIRFEATQGLVLGLGMGGMERMIEFVLQVVVCSNFAVDCKVTKSSRSLLELEQQFGMRQDRKCLD
jgi:hypothetical protein